MTKTVPTYQPVPPAWTYGTPAIRRRVIATAATLGFAFQAMTAAAPAFAQQAAPPVLMPCLPINGILPGGCGEPASAGTMAWMIEKFGNLEIAGMKIRDLGPMAEPALKMLAEGLPPHLVLQRIAAVLGVGVEAYNKSVETAETKARHIELIGISTKIAQALGDEANRLYEKIGRIETGQNDMRQDFQRRLDEIIAALEKLRLAAVPAPSATPAPETKAPRPKAVVTQTALPKPKQTVTPDKSDDIFDWKTFRFRKDRLTIQEYESIFTANQR